MGAAPVVQESACCITTSAPVWPDAGIKRRCGRPASATLMTGTALTIRSGRLLRLCAQQGAVRAAVAMHAGGGRARLGQPDRALAAQFARHAPPGSARLTLTALGHGPYAGKDLDDIAPFFYDPKPPSQQHRRGRRELLRAHGSVLLRRRGANLGILPGRWPRRAAARWASRAGGGGNHGWRARGSGCASGLATRAKLPGRLHPMPENAVPAGQAPARQTADGA